MSIKTRESRWSSTFCRVGVLVLAALVAPAVCPPPARAQTETVAGAYATIIVLDLSGSMLEPAADGGTKLDVAREALGNVLDRLPDTARIGLWVYGDSLPSGPDGSPQRETNCRQDIREVAAVAPIDRPRLQGLVEGLGARGDTPIALALTKAAAAIPEGTLGSLLLITDGRDECHPFGYGDDPAATAAALVGQGVRIRRIDTVGFGLDDEEAVAEMEAIARNGRGSFIPADDVVALERAVATLFPPELVTPLPAGQPVAGGAEPAAAPLLAATGSHVDALPAGEPRFYKVSVAEGELAALTATVFGLPASEGISLAVDSFFVDLNDGSVDLARPDFQALHPTVGLNRSGADSLRINSSWTWTGPKTSNEVIYRVVLASESPLPGPVTVELDTIRDARPQDGCEEGTVCWFETQLEQRSTDVEALRMDIEAIGAPTPESAAAALDAELVAARREVAVAEDRLGALRTAQDDAADTRTLGWLVTGWLTLMLVMAAGLAAWQWHRLRSTRRSTVR